MRWFNVNLHCNARGAEEADLRLGDIHGESLLRVSFHLTEIERVGYGITARVEGHTVRVGSRRFLEMEGIALTPDVRTALDEARRDRLGVWANADTAADAATARDFGAEGMRAETERMLGYRLEDLPEPPRRTSDTEHLGINPQKQDGLAYIGFPAYLGRMDGDQMVAVADVAVIPAPELVNRKSTVSSPRE